MGKIKQEVYQSSTLGPIPLSFTGRHLLQSLREAVTDMTDKAIKLAQSGQVGIKLEWDRVSEARGKIAQYMSKLEQGKLTPEGEGYEHPHPFGRTHRSGLGSWDLVPPQELLSDQALLDELKKRGYYLTRPKV